MSNKIKHDYVHSNDPKPETMLEATLAGLACLGCIFLTSTYIYIFLGGL